MNHRPSAAARLGLGASTAIGVAAGTAVGVASDSIASGVVFGAVGGILLGLVSSGRQRRSPDREGGAVTNCPAPPPNPKKSPC